VSPKIDGETIDRRTAGEKPYSLLKRNSRLQLQQRKLMKDTAEQVGDLAISLANQGKKFALAFPITSFL